MPPVTAAHGELVMDAAVVVQEAIDAWEDSRPEIPGLLCVHIAAALEEAGMLKEADGQAE